jgi:hypothetical protein
MAVVGRPPPTGGRHLVGEHVCDAPVRLHDHRARPGASMDGPFERAPHDQPPRWLGVLRGGLEGSGRRLVRRSSLIRGSCRRASRRFFSRSSAVSSYKNGSGDGGLRRTRLRARIVGPALVETRTPSPLTFGLSSPSSPTTTRDTTIPSRRAGGRAGSWQLAPRRPQVSPRAAVSSAAAPVSETAPASGGPTPIPCHPRVAMFYESRYPCIQAYLL